MSNNKSKYTMQYKYDENAFFLCKIQFIYYLFYKKTKIN